MKLKNKCRTCAAFTAIAVLVMNLVLSAGTISADGALLSPDTYVRQNHENRYITTFEADQTGDEQALEESITAEETEEETAEELSATALSTSDESADETSSEALSAAEDTANETSSEDPSAAEDTPEESSSEDLSTAEDTPEESSSEDPSTAEDTYEESSSENPSAAEDTLEESSSEDPTAAEDTLEEPSSEDPTASEETLEESSSDDLSAVDDSAIEQTIDEEAEEDQSAEDLSAAEESAEYDSAEARSEDNEMMTDDSDGDQSAGEVLLTEESAAEEGTDSTTLTDDVPDGTVVEGDEEQESVIPIENGSADTDNDDVFAEYVTRELELDEEYLEGFLSEDSSGEAVLAEDSTEETLSGSESSEVFEEDTEAVFTPSLRSYYASSRLEGYNREIYGQFLLKIKEVAAGELSSTVFKVPVKLTEEYQRTWTAEELGVDAIVVEENGTKKISSDATTALRNLLGISYYSINKALLADSPYDLYWYDKTISSTAGIGCSASKTNGEWLIRLTGTYTARFPVSADYSADGSTGTYEVNTSIGSAVTEAYNNARSIVEEYADCTDYEKLDAYRQEIIDRTSYNYDAINNSADYGDPWQLIYALDDDTENQVVCEGYSKAFQYLCDLSSFDSIFRECISVTGYLGDPETIAQLIANNNTTTLKSKGHMWNIVTLRDGSNYLVDITNCDGSSVGSGNNGRNLFLVGTGTEESTGVYCTGNVSDGYKFNLSSTGPGYVYNSDAISRFGESILTLSEGSVTADTVAEGEYTGNHTHVYIPIEEVQSTCIAQGHSAGEMCAICGEYSDDYTVYPLADHTPGTWTTTVEPDYDNEGTAVTQCTVCGIDLSKALPRLVHVESITLDQSSIDLYVAETATLVPTILPEDAADKSVSWSTENEKIAAVTQEGVVTGVSPGTTGIVASAENNCSYTCNVTVYDQLEEDWVNLIIEDTPVYDGTEKTPEVEVVDGNGITLTAGTDYTASYSNNINVGTGTITITGKGYYTGTVTKTFSIGKAEQTLSAEDVSMTMFTEGEVSASGAQGALSYESSDTSVAKVGTSNGQLTAIAPGTAYITITAAETENYNAASKKIKVTVTAYSLTANGTTVTVSTAKQTYDGTAKTPEVEVVDGNGITLTAGTDYTVSYSNNINAGTGQITITGKGNYSGTIEKTFSIARVSQPVAVKVSSSKPAVGKSVSITVTGAKGTVSYSSSDSNIAEVSSSGKVTAKKVGTAKITIISAGSANYYKATRTLNIYVVPAATTSLQVVNRPTGTRLTWARVAGATGYYIYRGSTKIKAISSGATLTYYDTAANTNGTRYTYKIYAKASTGVSPLYRSAAVYRLSRPTISTISSPTSSKALLKWAKNSSATGYQIIYSPTSDFSTYSYVNIYSASTLKRVVSNLTSKHVWYFRLRVRKKVGTVTYTSSWSPARCIKIK